jgi:hypothetical protein
VEPLHAAPAAEWPTAPAWESPLVRRTRIRLAARVDRLRIRYEHRADIHLALLQLACALIYYRHLPSF